MTEISKKSKITRDDDDDDDHVSETQSEATSSRMVVSRETTNQIVNESFAILFTKPSQRQLEAAESTLIGLDYLKKVEVFKLKTLVLKNNVALLNAPHDPLTQMIRIGVAVIPVIPNSEIADIQQKFRATLRDFP